MAINWQASYYRYRRYFTSLSHFYQSKKARTYTGIVLSILAITFFLTIAIRPTLVTIAGLIKQIDDQKAVTQKLEDKINALSQAQKEYEIVKNDLYLVEETLPQRPEVSTLIKQLETLSRRSGTVPDIIKIGQAEIMNQAAIEGGIKSVKINLAVSGDYQKLKTFLHSLATLRRIVLVDSFNFRAGKSGEQNLVLSLEAKAHYFQP